MADNPHKSETHEEGVEHELKLPFDPRTLLLGLWRRRHIPVALFLISCVVGVILSFTMGKKYYEVETVMLYKPQDETMEDSKSLFTQVNMVKILSNLQETRRRLGLSVHPNVIGASTDIFVQKNTKLMIFRTKWETAQMATDIANTLRDVFLNTQSEMKRKEAGAKITDYENRLEIVTRELHLADSALQEFNRVNEVIDLDKESQWYLEELTSIEMLYMQAVGDQRTLELQITQYEQILEELRNKPAGEQETPSGHESVRETNARIRQLREAIDSDKSYRVNMAELAQKQMEFERAKKLWEKGLISKNDFERAEVTYERQKALTVDTEEIKTWKAELNRLEGRVLPSESSPTSMGLYYEDMTRKSFEAKLQKIAVDEKVKNFAEARAAVKAKLGKLPGLEQRFISLTRDVKAYEAERAALESELSKARQIFESETQDFKVVADAKKPLLPKKSNRRLIVIITVFLGTIFGLALIVLLELLDSTIKSPAEIKLKLHLPLLGVLPKLPPSHPQFPGKESPGLIEPFNLIARRIRQAIPKQGGRILIVSAKPGEGRTWIAINLALSFGRQMENVLIADAQIRSQEEKDEFYDMFRQEEQGISIIQSGSRDKSSSTDLFTSVKTRALVKSGDNGGASSDGGKIDAVKAKVEGGAIAMAAKAAEWFDRQFNRLLNAEPHHESRSDRHDIRDLILYDGKALQGIGEYLSYKTDDIYDVVWPTILPGVNILPKFGACALPDLIGSSRMQKFLEEMSREFSIVLVDGPSVLPFFDAGVLAQWSDAIVLLIRAKHCRIDTLHNAHERLKEAGVPIVGVILNDVDSLYLDTH